MSDDEMLKDAEFENEMTAMGEDQLSLIKFNTRQQYQLSKVVGSNVKRIKRLEGQNKKVFSAVGIISASIVAAVNYLLGRGS